MMSQNGMGRLKGEYLQEDKDEFYPKEERTVIIMVKGDSAIIIKQQTGT